MNIYLTLWVIIQYCCYLFYCSDWTQIFNFYDIKITSFFLSFMVSAFCVLSKKSLSTPKLWRYSPRLSSGSITVLTLTFLIYYLTQVNFFVWCESRVGNLLPLPPHPISPTTFSEKLSVPSPNCFDTLVNSHLIILAGIFLDPHFAFWSIYLCFH